jgi:hypothetical protein
MEHAIIRPLVQRVQNLETKDEFRGDQIKNLETTLDRMEGKMDSAKNYLIGILLSIIFSGASLLISKVAFK